MLKKSLFLLTVSLLAGCTTHVDSTQPASLRGQGIVVGATGGAIISSISGTAPIGAIIGGVTGGAIGDYFAKHQNTAHYLTANGIQITAYDQQVHLLLPADKFFQPNSPAMNADYYPILNKIAVLLRQYQKISVQIAGYTDNVGPWQRNLALSKARAQKIADYLWNQGIDTRLLYSNGYGEQQPIASNATAQGRYINRRIEIILQQIDD